MTIQTISTENLPVIVHNQVPVVTTELLAKLYSTESVRIRQNFDRNTERFIEGKHFFKVTGEELKNFASSLKILTNSPIEVSSKTRYLTLWTERGAARHAKMLDTDQAWDVFEKLEDCYFGKQPEPVKNPRLHLRNTIHAVAKGDRQTYSNLYNRLYRKFQVTSYKELNDTQCVAAAEFIKSVQGEYIPRDKIEAPKPSLALCDGQHYVVAKDGAVLMHKVLSHDINDSCLKTMGIGQDKFAALAKDLAQFCAPEDPHLQITYATAQRTLSLLSALMVHLENYGFNMALMYQKTQYVQNFLTNYYSRLEAIHFQMCSISKNMSLDAINYASDICKHPTVVSCYGAKIA